VTVTVTVAASTVTFHDPCGTAGDTYAVTTTEGVQFEVGGRPVGAGAHDAVGDVSVDARPMQGYVLIGVTHWQHTFSAAACATASTLPRTGGLTWPLAAAAAVFVVSGSILVRTAQRRSPRV
jgi:hypothetical protein